ncbi:unnamed protein product [Ectocarpus sp. CCAP 1310/34]|nr:unnamed protein product [Ectocarpus sp. CCAP 1310/34]
MLWNSLISTLLACLGFEGVRAANTWAAANTDPTTESSLSSYSRR